MKYRLEGDLLKFDHPLKKSKGGLKVLFYRDPRFEAEKIDYPVAYTDIKKGQTIFSLPDETIKVFEVIVKQPKYRFFPFIWHEWKVIESIPEPRTNKRII